MDSDEDIVLLKQPCSEGNDADESNNFAPNFNFSRENSVLDQGNEIDPASVHALKAAFSTLKKSYNEQKKQINELTQKNKTLIQKKNSSPVSSGQIGSMLGDNNAAVGTGAVGAGSPSDDETHTAELRAKQGYIQHLERELLRSNNILAKGNLEIDRLKNVQLEYEARIKSLQEGLNPEIQNLVENLQQHKDEILLKDKTIHQLQENLHSVTVKCNKLQDENNELRRHLETSDRSLSQLTIKDNEIQELKTRLRSLDQNQYIKDLQKQLDEKEREKLALEAKHKQYAIENEINRQTVAAQIQRETESQDEVDGDRVLLQKAIQLISQHNETMKELKYKIEQQRLLIHELNNIKVPSVKADPAKDIEEREAAQGASFHPEFKEKSVNPIYMNVNSSHQPNVPLSNVSNFSHVKPESSYTALVRRPSDRDEHRGIVRSEQQVSPRINDIVKPTGNTNVPRMMAAEVNVPPVDGGNVLDSIRAGKGASPRQQRDRSRQGDMFGPGTVCSNSDSTFIQNMTTPTNIQQDENNQRTVYNASPRQLRQHSPSSRSDLLISPNSRSDRQVSPFSQAERQLGNNLPISDETSVVNISSSNMYGSRQQPRNEVNLLNTRQNSSYTNRIPDRMTQSEIIIRDTPPTVPEISTQVPHLDLRYLMSASQENLNPQSQQGAVPKQNRVNLPNYENVYEARDERNSDSPNNVYDHSIYVNDPDLLMGNTPPTEVTAQQPSQQEQGNNVSALKICPVCNIEFSRLTMDQFQTHVFDCFDNTEEPPATLQPGMNLANQSEGERTCPMCGNSFPMTIPQETYEQHVLAHFGEEPLMDTYEMLN